MYIGKRCITKLASVTIISRTINLTDIIGLIVLSGSVIITGGPVGLDPGVGWHLAAGRWISTNHSIPFHQLFILPDLVPENWVHDQWLADFIMYKIYNYGGIMMLHLFVVGMFLSIVLWIFRAQALDYSSSPFAAFLSVLIVVQLLAVQLIIRPVVFSFLFFSVLFLYLQGKHLQRPAFKQEQTNWVFLVKSLGIAAIFFTTWANLHPGFMMGLILLIIDLILTLSTYKTPSFAYRLCTSCMLLFVAIGATLMNPYGYDLHLSIYRLLGNSYFTNLNQEWLSPNLLDTGMNPILFLLAILTLFLSSSQSKHLSFFQLLSLALFLFLALNSRRFIPFFAIVAVGPLTSAIDWLLTPIKHRFDRLTAFPPRVPLTFAVFLCMIGYVCIYKSLPIRNNVDSPTLMTADNREIKELVSTLPPHSRLFHSPNFGGLLTWNFWPKLNIFADDRNQIVPESVYKDFFKVTNGAPEWKTILDKYEINALLIEPTDALQWLVDSSWSCKRSHSGFKLCLR